MSVLKVVVDTDVFIDFLVFDVEKEPPGRHPLFRELLSHVFCYTTVFNAAELFSLMSTRRETAAADDALAAVKLLGANARGAKTLGALLRSRRDRGADALATMIGGLCREARLPLVTGRSDRYRGIPGLVLMPARKLGRARPVGQLFKVLEHSGIRS